MRIFWIFVLAAMLLNGLAMVSAAAEPAAPAAANQFAMIDMDKVISGYEAFKQANDEFSRYAMEVERKLDQNRRLRLLEDKEVQELKDLRAAVIKNPEQNLRQQQLEQLSDVREQELGSFEQKAATLTPEEQTRRNALIAIAQKRAGEVTAAEKNLTEARDEKNKTMAAPFNTAIKKALEKVAKQNRVSVIFNNSAVLWVALDLTEPVLAELNAAKKPAAGK